MPTDTAETLQSDYRISVEPLPGPISAIIDGVQVASSDKALVMHESFLPSCVYFPLEDVDQSLLRRSTLHTFCPFKGTASYWSVALDDGVNENAAWSYKRPLDAGLPVGGYISFAEAEVERYEADDNTKAALVPPVPTTTGSSSLLEWLLLEAWLAETPGVLTAELARHLSATGMPLMRLNVGIWTLHPQLVGKTLTWTKAADSVTVVNTPRGALTTPAYLKSPVRFVSEGLGGVRQRLDVENPEFHFPVMDELREAGGTDYVAMPLPFSDGQIHTLTLASDDPNGFTVAGLGQLYLAIPTLSRLFEAHTVRQNTAVLLDTYLGPRTGRQVLNGLTQRGDGENIHAVIWFCDLRESSALADSMPREEFLQSLNDYFDAVGGAVQEHGGEVLRFIGDAVLAIFPTGENGGSGPRHSAAQACYDAIEAVRSADSRMIELNERRSGENKDPLGFGIGLHLGEVTYGNIGTPERLEFTVIGAAANEAARLENLTKELQTQVLVSDTFAGAFPETLKPMGRHALRGVNQEMDVFTLAS